MLPGGILLLIIVHYNVTNYGRGRGNFQTVIFLKFPESHMVLIDGVDAMSLLQIWLPVGIVLTFLVAVVHHFIDKNT